jgi:hypothetical protein
MGNLAIGASAASYAVDVRRAGLWILPDLCKRTERVSHRSLDGAEELHVQLQPVAGERFLIALPALPLRLMLLMGREAVHPVSAENAVHRGARHRDLVKSLQIIGDLAGPENGRSAAGTESC